MNIWRFLQDRLFFIFIYLLNVTLILLVIELDLFQSDLILKEANLGYIIILSVAVLVLYLTVSYLRQWLFYREFNRAKTSQGIDRALKLENGVTAEQKAFQSFIHENYQDYTKELVTYQERQEQHHHFMNQWVHSMKTPVSVTNLLIQQGREAESLEDARALMASIAEENERVAHGLDMVLHMARLEKFEVDVSLTRVNLVGLVRSVINDHKKEMIRYAIFPRLEHGKEEIFVETDMKWLSFVVNQLTANAIKYTAKGKNRRIIYSIQQKQDSCRLSITDEGIGIPQQDVGRIFDPFFTGENGRQGKESTGMGLYLAQEVCTRLGHHLAVDSSEGEGTTMTIAFSSKSIISDTLRA